MNIAIVDDSKSDCFQISQILKQYSAIHQLLLHIDHFSSGEALLTIYQPFSYTVIFLDIYMNSMSGIETAEKIRAVDEDSVIIFLTNSEIHHREAFSVFATAYLNKPSSETEVFRIMDHILRVRTGKEKRFSFSHDRQNYSLRFADIVSLETDGNYLIIKDCRGRNYRTRMTFSHAETQMDSRFLTLMKGIMVNMDYIEQIQNTICSMHDGSHFPLHIKKENEILQKWLNYKFAAIREATEISEG